MYVVSGSYAEDYAKTNELKYEYLTTGENPSVLVGDANGDGEITAFDARLVLKMAASEETPTAEEIALLDTNGDGKITAFDARNILKAAASA